MKEVINRFVPHNFVRDVIIYEIGLITGVLRRKTTGNPQRGRCDSASEGEKSINIHYDDA
jgi:hypothetical protein